jgi:hypothetical protein
MVVSRVVPLAGGCTLAVVIAMAGLAAGPGPAPAAPAVASARAEQAPPAATSCSKVWIGREAEFEEFLRTAPIERIEDVGTGVTRPKRVEFAPGGLARRAAWKPLKPGIHQGYWDSYKAELAAYELDKLLGMGMVPPAVERRVEGELGAMVLWVEDVSPWRIDKPIVGPDQAAWNRQVVSMKMFDGLIANVDRNQGNLIYDREYHLILIDHSRAFTPKKDLVAQPTRYYKTLWDSMAALTAATLAPLEPIIGKKEVAAILTRRDRMARELKKLEAQKGAAAAYLP